MPADATTGPATPAGDAHGAEIGPEDVAAPLISGPFLVVTGVTFLFFLYVGVQVPLIPKLIEDRLGGSEFDIGLNLAVFSVSAIAIRPLLGPWGDRYGRRILMVVGSLLAAAGAAASAAVGDRWLLLPLRAVSGIGEGALFVGAATMINDFAPAHRRAEAASYFSVAVFGGIGVGPIIGEVLTEGGHFGRGLLVSALFAVAASAAALLVPERRPAVGRVVDHENPTAAESLSDVLVGTPAGAVPEHRFHRAAILPGTVLALGIGGFATFNAFIPEHADSVGLDGSKWVFSLYSIVCLVVRLVGAKLPERLGLARAVTAALSFLACGLVVLGAFATPLGVYAAAVLVGLGMSFMYPALMAMTVNGVSDHERARVISTFTMFFEVGTAGGGLLFGFLAELTSKRGGFLAGAVSSLVGLWFFWTVLLPSVRRRPISASATPATATH